MTLMGMIYRSGCPIHEYDGWSDLEEAIAGVRDVLAEGFCVAVIHKSMRRRMLGWYISEHGDVYEMIPRDVTDATEGPPNLTERKVAVREVLRTGATTDRVELMLVRAESNDIRAWLGSRKRDAAAAVLN